MFNTSKYNKSRLSSYIDGIIPSFISLFTKRNKDLIILNSFHNMAFSDNTKFLFKYLINNEEKTIKYVINDDNLRDELNTKYGNYFIETKSTAGKKLALSAYLWFTNSFEFPVSGFFLKFRRVVIQLTHGAPIKNAGLCENDISVIKKIYYAILKTNITYILSPSVVFNDFMAKHAGLSSKKVITNGYPRYDPLFNNEYTKITFNDSCKRILYAPTWRHYSKVELFPFTDFNLSELDKKLKEMNVKIYLRLHPRFEDEISPELLTSEQVCLFSGKDYPEINEYLGNFDALITDYSSIMYDFMILNRPVFYFPYDYDEYNQKIGFAVDYKKFAIGYHSKLQYDFLKTAYHNL